jgi:hypothetical protein
MEMALHAIDDQRRGSASKAEQIFTQLCVNGTINLKMVGLQKDSNILGRMQHWRK